MEIAFIIHILERNVSSTPVQSQLGAVVIHKCKHMSKGVGFFETQLCDAEYEASYRPFFGGFQGREIK